MSVGLILKRELSMASIDLDLKPWHDLKEGLLWAMGMPSTTYKRKEAGIIC